MESELAVTLLRYALEQVEVLAGNEPDEVVLLGPAAGSKASLQSPGTQYRRWSSLPLGTPTTGLSTRSSP